MSECQRPVVDYPCRVPLKVIGHANLLQAEQVRRVILEQLGPQADGDERHSVNCKGAYISLTFWVTLPHDRAEEPLRRAIHALPGVVMQL